MVTLHTGWDSLVGRMSTVAAVDTGSILVTVGERDVIYGSALSMERLPLKNQFSDVASVMQSGGTLHTPLVLCCHLMKNYDVRC